MNAILTSRWSTVKAQALRPQPAPAILAALQGRLAVNRSLETLPRPVVTLLMVVVLLVILLPVGAAAQADDDPTASSRQDLRRWLEGERRELQDFLTEQDREFANFLEEAWKEYDLATGRQRDTTPKPVDRPRPETPDPVVIPMDTVAAPLPVWNPPPVAPTPMVPADRPVMDVDFLGLTYRLPLDPSTRSLPPSSVSPKAAGEAWLRLGAANHQPLLTALQDHVSSRQLGDWGQFQLLETVARRVYPTDPVRRALLHWYLGVRSGLDLRLAYARPGFAVLYATCETVYQVEFLMYREQAYYIHDPDGRFSGTDRLRTYEAQPPQNTRPIGFDLAHLPLTEPDPVERRLEWTLSGTPRVTEITVDRHLGEFLGTVPQTRLVSHFGAGLGPMTLSSIREGLEPDLAVRDDIGRVSVLLRFVQSALDYATDQEQFGREDYLYPDESLFYPQCDCEDRSALFAVLVRELVGLDVVGLDYPGHIATAVALPSPVPGDHFRWQGREYTVCDPTFIGAGPGRSMPIAGADAPGIIDAGH